MSSGSCNSQPQAQRGKQGYKHKSISADGERRPNPQATKYSLLAILSRLLWPRLLNKNTPVGGPDGKWSALEDDTLQMPPSTHAAVQECSQSRTDSETDDEPCEEPPSCFAGLCCQRAAFVSDPQQPHSQGTKAGTINKEVLLCLLDREPSSSINACIQQIDPQQELLLEELERCKMKLEDVRIPFPDSRSSVRSHNSVFDAPALSNAAPSAHDLPSPDALTIGAKKLSLTNPGSLWPRFAAHTTEPTVAPPRIAESAPLSSILSAEPPPPPVVELVSSSSNMMQSNSTLAPPSVRCPTHIPPMRGMPRNGERIQEAQSFLAEMFTPRETQIPKSTDERHHREKSAPSSCQGELQPLNGSMPWFPAAMEMVKPDSSLQRKQSSGRRKAANCDSAPAKRPEDAQFCQLLAKALAEPAAPEDKRRVRTAAAFAFPLAPQECNAFERKSKLSHHANKKCGLIQANMKLLPDEFGSQRRNPLRPEGSKLAREFSDRSQQGSQQEDNGSDQEDIASMQGSIMSEQEGNASAQPTPQIRLASKSKSQISPIGSCSTNNSRHRQTTRTRNQRRHKANDKVALKSGYSSFECLQWMCSMGKLEPAPKHSPVVRRRRRASPRIN